MAVTRYFLGGNTASGFVSFYGQFCRGPEDFLWVIKGGPGCGKSSFTRAVEAGRRRRAAPDVAVADEAHGEVRNIGCRAAAGGGAAAGRATTDTVSAAFSRKVITGNISGMSIVFNLIPTI